MTVFSKVSLARPCGSFRLRAGSDYAQGMCNLYSIIRSQESMRRLFAAARDLTGNLPPLSDVFPDQLAPIVRVAEGDCQLEMMR